MPEQYTIETLIEIVGGDAELVDALYSAEIIDRDAEITQVVLERARVACCLMRDLEVNIHGVEIILRLREELLTTRHQVFELAQRLRDR